MLSERSVEQNGVPNFCVDFNDLCVVFFTLDILLLLVPSLVVSLFTLGI